MRKGVIATSERSEVPSPDTPIVGTREETVRFTAMDQVTYAVLVSDKFFHTCA